MRGAMVVNGFLAGGKFDEPAMMMAAAARGMGIGLDVLRNCDLCRPIGESPLEDADFVVFWDKDVALAMSLEAAGMRLFNPAQCIMDCDDKVRTHLALARAGVPSLRTIACPKTFEGVGYTDRGFLGDAARALGFPMVVKDCFGSFGQQVHLVHDITELEALVTGDRPMIMQEYVECDGEDLRIEVVGGEAVAAVRRKAKPGEFRANATLGGTMHPHEPTREESDLAVAAAEAVEADFCGVDILSGPDGPAVIEVNSNAHLRNITECTGIDIATAIMAHIRNTVGRMECWILYDRADLEKNRFFAERLRDSGSSMGLGCDIVISDSIDPGDAPDVVVSRSRDHRLICEIEDSGATVYNRSSVTRICCDKAETYRFAAGLGMPIPPYSLSPDSLPPGPPWVVKSRIGHGGSEVFEARSREEVAALMDQNESRLPMVQSMAPVRGRDMRCYVLGGRVIASVMRSSDIDFRANFSLGGRAKLVDPPAAAVEMIRKMVPELMPDFVGFDFLFGEDGEVYLNEIEDPVGTRMLYELTDLDAASLYMRYVADRSGLRIARRCPCRWTRRARSRSCPSAWPRP